MPDKSTAAVPFMIDAILPASIRTRQCGRPAEKRRPSTPNAFSSKNATGAHTTPTVAMTSGAGA